MYGIVVDSGIGANEGTFQNECLLSQYLTEQICRCSFSFTDDIIQAIVPECKSRSFTPSELPLSTLQWHLEQVVNLGLAPSSQENYQKITNQSFWEIYFWKPFGICWLWQNGGINLQVNCPPSIGLVHPVNCPGQGWEPSWWKCLTCISMLVG